MVLRTYLGAAQQVSRQVLGPILLSLLVAACSHHSGQSSSTAQALAMHDTAAADASEPIRHQAMRDTALRYGAQNGLAAKTIAINKTLEHEESYLNRIFNFNSLLLPHNLLPPVLVESRDTLNLDTPDSMRLSDRAYKIVRPARFVTSAPSWRNASI